MDEKGLGVRLQTVRVRAGLTQQALCQSAGLSYSTLTKIERGAIKSPSIFTIQRIAGSLNVSLDELLGQPLPVQSPKRRSKSGVSFIYFDINGCLVHYFQRAFSLITEDTGALPDIVERVFWHYNDEVCRGELFMSEFNRLTAREIRVDSFDWQKYYLEAVEPVPHMQELVRWAAEHYHVGLFSNIMPGLIEAMIAKNVLPAITYDSIVDSSIAKSIKPESKIYQIGAAQAGCPENEILLIDNERPNLMAAERQGWHAMWFDDSQAVESAERIKRALAL